MKKQKPKFPFKIFFTVSIIIFTAIFFVRCAVIKLQNSAYFKIRDVISNEKNLSDLSFLLGYNIFSVDLRHISQNLLERFPDYKKIRLIRVFPDRLFVDFVKRLPLARVLLYRFFYVDSDGVLFEAPVLSYDPELPVISGLDTKIFGPKAGTKYSIRELKTALSIIKEIKANKAFKEYRIKKIDIEIFSNASIFLSPVAPIGTIGKDEATINEPIEIKIGQDNISDKINILSNLLAQVNSERFNVKYIDLRFKEPVIKLKNTQAPKGGVRP